ncbi:uncharacterized protein LOC126248357 [Schistocerca nitens]|uniref:uncharacterized protein LOC126248357 n=1 Tax=Schistocerca nitens TaxID=7011 RepID=UPI0021178732|nr:uncharacterized protein LOC126248357 [Schistocerca nitens]
MAANMKQSLHSSDAVTLFKAPLHNAQVGGKQKALRYRRKLLSTLKQRVLHLARPQQNRYEKSHISEVPSKGSETVEQDVDTPETIATPPGKSSRKKGKKRKTGGKAGKKAVEPEPTIISPLENIVMLKGKTETLEKTSVKKRIKRSAAESDLQEPVALLGAETSETVLMEQLGETKSKKAKKNVGGRGKASKPHKKRSKTRGLKRSAEIMWTAAIAASTSATKDEVQSKDSNTEEQDVETPKTVAPPPQKRSKKKDKVKSKGSKMEGQEAVQPKTVGAAPGHTLPEEGKEQSEASGKVEQLFETQKTSTSVPGKSSKKKGKTGKTGGKAGKKAVEPQQTTDSPPVKKATKKVWKCSLRQSKGF